MKSETAETLLPAFDFENIVGGKLRRAAARTRPGTPRPRAACARRKRSPHAAPFFLFFRAVVLLVVDIADFDGSFPAVAAKMLSSIGDSLHVVRFAKCSSPRAHVLTP